MRRSASGRDGLHGVVPSLVRGSLRVPVLGHLGVWHQGLGPVDRAETDAQQAHSKTGPEHDIGQTRLPDARDELVRPLVDGEVGNQKYYGGHHRDTEKGCNLAFCSMCGLLAQIRRARYVWVQFRLSETRSNM